MGADGAKGLLAMRRAGWHTIAQDQATSIVYGMPKAAAKIDAAVEILPLDQIAAAITRAASVPLVASKGPQKESHMTDHVAGCGNDNAPLRSLPAAFACFWWTTNP